MKYFLRALAVCLIVTLSIWALTSCVSLTKTRKDADYTITQDQQRLENEQAKAVVREPAAVDKSGYYVDPKPIGMGRDAAWLNQRITVSAQNLPLEFVVARILRNTNTVVEYQHDMNRQQTVTLEYSGTIRGALNQLAASTDTAYEIQGNRVVWQAFVTKMFNISFMPGTSTYQVGQLPNESGSAAGGGAAAGGSGTTVVTTQGQLGTGQYSDLKGELSVWQDLTRTLNELKSPEGKVSVSESTTTVTVFDRPSNVRAMGRYIAQLNNDLSREVAIQVEVLEIELNKDFNLGIDWNVVQHWLGTDFSLNGALATGANITRATQGSQVNNNLVLFTIGEAGNNAIIQALTQQGRVSVVTQPRVVTMNNQMAQIRITRDTSYLQSVSTTTTVNAGTTSSLTPGIVTDGFTLYLLPKIKNQHVYLQISSTLSTLTAINQVTNAPSLDAAQSSNGQFQQIQVPTLTEKQFNQRTLVNSGSTLVITGFQQVRNETQRNQLFGLQPLGGQGAARTNVQTIVLITPTILTKM